MGRKVARPPPPILPTCLQPNLTADLPLPSAADYTPAWDTKIHVAFYDTRKKPATGSMLMAAALFNTSRVLFHVLLVHPRPVPGMRVTDVSRLPPLVECLHTRLKRLAHGPGPQYLLKPLLHWVMPREVRRLILLDTDVVVVRGIAPLWAQFRRFDGAVLGVGNEQSNLYKAPDGRPTGKNGGVQLLHFDAMRASRPYAAALDEYASGRAGKWIGYLGDQTFYTHLATPGGPLARLVYTLPCEWNRQISMQFGFRNSTIHTCPRKCALLHANYRPIKCVVGLMQRRPSCEVWRRFYMRSRPELSDCGSAMRPQWAEFQRGLRSFFSDCCVE